MRKIRIDILLMVVLTLIAIGVGMGYSTTLLYAWRGLRMEPIPKKTASFCFYRGISLCLGDGG